MDFAYFTCLYSGNSFLPKLSKHTIIKNGISAFNIYAIYSCNCFILKRSLIREMAEILNNNFGLLLKIEDTKSITMIIDI